MGALAWSAAAATLATEFSVTPIRVDLAASAMTQTITVTNDGDRPLNVQVKLFQWTQDATGADVYDLSSDLIYFPRQLQVEPGGRRLVRVGSKAPGGSVERAYRLFIEEQPEPGLPPAQARLNFLFRFGVPIFVAPAVPKPQPEIGDPVLEAGKVSIVVRNSGNATFRLTRVAVSNTTGFAQQATGWYSLPGSTRTYSLELPRDVCRQGGSLDVLLEGEKFKFDRKLQVDPARCTSGK